MFCINKALLLLKVVISRNEVDQATLCMQQLLLLLLLLQQLLKHIGTAVGMRPVPLGIRHPHP